METQLVIFLIALLAVMTAAAAFIHEPAHSRSRKIK